MPRSATGDELPSKVNRREQLGCPLRPPQGRFDRLAKSLAARAGPDAADAYTRIESGDGLHVIRLPEH
jgi:hypothetical protein